MMYQIVDMALAPNDVCISSRNFHGTLHEVYTDVRDTACTLARCEELTKNIKTYVDMSKNEDGYPVAEIYNQDGKCFHQILVRRN